MWTSICRRSSAVFAALTLLSYSAAAALAQAPAMATLQITVVDATGAVIVDADVTVKNSHHR